MGDAATRPPTFLSGGGGLVSTAADYHRFTQMLARGGELDGVAAAVAAHRRLHDPQPPARQRRPGGRSAARSSPSPRSAASGSGWASRWSSTRPRCAVLTSVGEYAWGGLASTAFYVDPVEEITAMFFTQLMPSSTYPIRTQLRTLVTQALVD